MKRLRLLAAAGVFLAFMAHGNIAFGDEPPLIPMVAVGPQYDTTHVYVTPADLDRFQDAMLATFGGTHTKRAQATVTPTASSAFSEAIQTPAGSISLFGYTAPIPYPFGLERTGYLVTDMDVALKAAQSAGAEIVVAPFPDPIGRDAVIRWPGGVMMQFYWHTTPPHYAAFATIPENRVYVSPDAAETFVHDFLAFSHGAIISDEKDAPGVEIGKPATTYRRIRIESTFGYMSVLVTNGQLPYPYGYETTGYEVDDVVASVAKATAAGATVLVAPYTSEKRRSSMLLFPGGYVAEIHAAER